VAAALRLRQPRPRAPGYWNPNGVDRADAVTRTGCASRRAPATLAAHFFDAYGIEYGILNKESSLRIGLSPEPDFAAAVASALNDVIVTDWLPADPRFRASLIVSVADPELAAREIHRLGDHPGIVQVLMPSGARIPYGQRFYHPIYAAAVEHGLPVAIHPGSDGVGVSGPPGAVGYPGSYLEWHTGLVCGAIGPPPQPRLRGRVRQVPGPPDRAHRGGPRVAPPRPVALRQELEGAPPDDHLAWCGPPSEYGGTTSC
jgi:predicted TIM-barrel fold metal-dependent hydrolase